MRSCWGNWIRFKDARVVLSWHIRPARILISILWAAFTVWTFRSVGEFRLYTIGKPYLIQAS